MSIYAYIYAYITTPIVYNVIYMLTRSPRSCGRLRAAHYSTDQCRGQSQHVPH